MDEWIGELAAAYPDEPWITEAITPPVGAEVEPWQEFYFTAWRALHADRRSDGFSGAEYPIPFVAVDAYARRYRIEGDQFETLLRMIAVIDGAYLEWRDRQAEEERKRREDEEARR